MKYLLLALLLGCHKYNVEVTQHKPGLAPAFGTVVICPEGTYPRVSVDKVRGYGADSLNRLIVICRTAFHDWNPSPAPHFPRRDTPRLQYSMSQRGSFHYSNLSLPLPHRWKI